MANEAVKIELHGANNGDVIRYDVADGEAIEKGTLMVLALSGVRLITAAGRTPIGQAIIETPVGIASTEKKADDGQTTLGVWTKGFFDIKNGTTNIPYGTLVNVSGSNMIIPATAAMILSGQILGKAVEQISASGTGVIKLGGVTL